MLKLYKNKNQIFEAAISVDGADISKAKPRLVLFPSNDNRNVFFEGVIENGTCKVILTPNLEISKTGKAVLEIIIDNSTLFQPWNTTYEIITEQVKIQSESISLATEQNKPTVRIIEDIKVKDDKNKVINKPIEKKIIPKSNVIQPIHNKFQNELFHKSVSDESRKMINEFLSTVNSLEKKEKKALLEYITKSYTPDGNTVKWAKSILLDKNSLVAKISMYCHDLERKKK